MIFIVTYENQIESLFFHIWDAQQHINFFDKEVQSKMELIRIDERDVKELQGLQKILETCKKTGNNHCCGNCGRTCWDKGVLLCKFNHKETNPNDYCIHYI